MTRNELVKKVSDRTDIDPEVCKRVFEATIEEMRKSLIKQEPIFIRGLGTFRVKKRAEKLCRNISKGTTMIKPADLKPILVPSKALQREINDNDY